MYIWKIIVWRGGGEGEQLTASFGHHHGMIKLLTNFIVDSTRFCFSSNGEQFQYFKASHNSARESSLGAISKPWIIFFLLNVAPHHCMQHVLSICILKVTYHYVFKCRHDWHLNLEPLIAYTSSWQHATKQWRIRLLLLAAIGLELARYSPYPFQPCQSDGPLSDSIICKAL